MLQSKIILFPAISLIVWQGCWINYHETVLLVNPDQNIGLDNKSNYRRYRLGDLSVLRVNYRRFPIIQIYFQSKFVHRKPFSQPFPPKKKGFSQPKYKRFGAKRASYIWIIGVFLSPCYKYRNKWSIWGPVSNIDNFFSSYIWTRDENKPPIIYIFFFIVCFSVVTILNFLKI